MKITKRLSIFLFSSVLFLSTCGSDTSIDDSLKNIPGDITSLTVFNMKQLLQKADFDYIQSLEIYKDEILELKKGNPILASIVEQAINSGLDLTKHIYLVVDVDPNEPKEKFYGFILSIADHSMFETMLSQAKVGVFQNGDQFKFVINRNNLLAWNETFALIGNGNRSFDIHKEIARFFNHPPEESAANNLDLKKCLSKEYDIATWINSDFLANNQELKKSAALIGISNEAFQANYLHAYLNFNAGNITGNSKHFLQKELTNDLNLFFKDGINQNLSKYIPADNLGMLVGGALDAKGIYQVISEKVGGYAMLNKSLKPFGFSAKDISHAFGADVVLGFYGLSDASETQEVLLASNINDKSTFNKFIDLAQQFDMLEKQAENLYLIKDHSANLIISKRNALSYLLIKDDLFFISANESIIQTIKDGGYRSADQIDASIYNSIVSESLGTYIDLEKYKHLFNGLEKDKQAFTNVVLNASLKEANLKVEMADKNMNSFKAMLNLMNEIHLSRKKPTTAPNI